MEAQLTMASVKTLTKCLTCLARYSDDMDILALPNSLTLSATNASKSAYCRLLLQASFFSSYSVRKVKAGDGTGSSFRTATTQAEEGRSVKARLKTKLLLSHLRHRNHEKGVKSVKLIIREPPEDDEEWAPGADEESEEEEGSMESRMLVKFFCDHGVIKQHRLRLEYPDELLAPHVDEDQQEKTVVINKPCLKSMLDRVRVGQTKADGQIDCDFNPADMVVKTAADKGEIHTQVKMIGEDLVRYETGPTTISLSFHIREFAATIALAESIDKHLKITFTEAPAPLILYISPIEPDEDDRDTWDFQAFVATSGSADVVPGNGAKRTRANNDGPRQKVPRVTRETSPNQQPAEQQNDETEDNAGQQPFGYNDDTNDDVPIPQPRPSQGPHFQLPRPSQAGPSGTYHATHRASTFRVPIQSQQPLPPSQLKEEPLFLPPTQQSPARRDIPQSQYSPASRREIYEQSGMDLNEEDVNAFLDLGDDFEDEDDNQIQRRAEASTSRGPRTSVAAQPIQFGPTQHQGGTKKFIPIFGNSMLDADEPELLDEQEEFQPTQHSRGRKKFQPMFDD